MRAITGSGSPPRRCVDFSPNGSSPVPRSRRWSADHRPRRLLFPVLGAAGIGVGVTAEAALYGWSHPGSWVPDLATGWLAVGCGLTAASIGRYTATGVLLAVTGFAWFVPDYASSSSGWLLAHSLYWYRGPLVQLVLTYPRGRPVGRVETAAVGAGYAAAVIPAVWESDVATVALAAAAVSARWHARM